MRLLSRCSQKKSLPNRILSLLLRFTTRMSSAFSGGLGDPSLTVFSPAECLVGGIFIGLSVVARAFALGTVTGISGIFGASVRLESFEKAAFSIGLFLSGVALFWGSPAPFLRVPDGLPVYRPIVAAILVAVGTHFGNGCTRLQKLMTHYDTAHVFLQRMRRLCCGLMRAGFLVYMQMTLRQRARHLRHLAPQRPLFCCRSSFHVRVRAYMLDAPVLVTIPCPFRAFGFLVSSLSRAAADFGVLDVSYAPASPAFAGTAAALIACGACSW